MAITASQVKELREKTGVGMMDAKKALVETDGDMDKAIDVLREKGMAKAAKKADAVAAEGMTFVAVKDNAAAIIELNSQTDFVAVTQSLTTCCTLLQTQSLNSSQLTLKLLWLCKFLKTLR